MKPFPADCVMHALAAVWSISTVAAQAAHSVAPDLISDEKAFAISLTTGVFTAIFAGVASKGGGRERFATLAASVGFALWFGPVSAVLVMAKYNIYEGYSTMVMVGTSAIFGLLGWPFYKFCLALFVAADGQAGSIGKFFGAAFKAFMRRGH